MTTTPPEPVQPEPVQPGPPAATPPKYAAPLPPVPPAPAAPPPHWQAHQPAAPQPPMPPMPHVQQPAQQQYPQGFPPPAAAQPAQPAQPALPPQPVQPQGYPQQPGYAPPVYGQPPVPNYAQVPGYQGQPGVQGYPGYAPAVLPVPGPGEPFDGAATAEDFTRPLYGATIAQAFTRFFKNYASFSGRASRSEYWWIVVIFGALSIIGSILINILTAMMYGFSYSAYDATNLIIGVIGLVYFVVAAGILVPSLAITWRRLHDANLPGPFFLLAFVPFFGQIALVILLALPPQIEGRRFFRGM